MICVHSLRSRPFLKSAKSKSGQTLVEYGLTLALISVIAIATLAATGTQVSSVFTTINRQVAIAGNGGPAPAPPPPHGG